MVVWVSRSPWRLRAIAGALVFLSLCGCSAESPDTDDYQAWYRPVPLGFCPRYIIGDRHAWVVGQIAPGTERQAIERRVFTFRGYFELDAEGYEKTRSSCDDRAYPIFHLVEMVGERLMELGEEEPKIVRGPGRVEVIADPVPAPSPQTIVDEVTDQPAVTKPRQRRFEGKRNRRTRRRVKQRRQRRQ